MLTRKGLVALVAGVADGAAAAGITRDQATAVAVNVIRNLRDAGAVTPGFDSVRFADALADALAAHGIRQEVAA